VLFYKDFFDCQKCPGAIRYNDPVNGLRPVFDEGAADPSYVIIGMNPGRDEIKQGRPFVGAAGKVLRGIMKEAQTNWQKDTDSDDTPLRRGLFTNMARCQFVFEGTQRNRTPSDDEYAACIPVFDHMWNHVRPSVVLGCGAAVLKLFDIHIPISKCCGGTYDVTRNGVSCKFVPMYHPAFYHRMLSQNTNKAIQVRSRMVDALSTVIELVLEHEAELSRSVEAKDGEIVQAVS